MSGQRAGRVLEAKHPQLLRRRADEGDTGVFAGLGKCSIFGEKAVARMNGIGAAGFGDGEDFVHRQIRPGRTAVAQAVGFVGLHQVQAGSVSFAIHGHTFDLQSAQGPQNAAGNGATVGDQQFVEHGITPETQPRSVSWWEAGRPAIDLSTQRSSVAEDACRVSRESATVQASGCSRCTDYSTAGSWRSARSRPSRHATQRICRVQKYRLQRSGRRRRSPARS
ncbi:hypothetical protein ALO94_201133 [Pseudomonas syringae pv. spinaceae]|uniref:Uncharacterized protein n=1 Tax=Pseudomonas syringae pv. spinaceae TaxID=264459 RepID=A0A0P9Z919_PSESX|nr:hypothetical protein ALO94_201133 [Pseudomonas syringae pv. spinaceae]